MPISTTTTTAPALSDWTRLHISPFTPALLPTILPPSLQAQARNISYHALQTFPDTGYGFVELPPADAQKLRTKLNGSILRGIKVSVEPAREDGRMKRARATEAEAQAEQSGKDKKSKKRKTRLEGELPGEELPEGRKVKRGWEENSKTKRKDKDGKKKANAQKEEKGKMLFRTTVPPNKLENVEPSKKKKRKSDKEPVEIKEFDSSKPLMSFLRQEQTSKSRKASDFVEGKGWVDETGNIVEPVKKGKKPSLSEQQKHEKHAAKATKPKKTVQQPAPRSDTDESSSEESSVVSSDSDSDDSSETSEAPPPKVDPQPTKNADTVSTAPVPVPVLLPSVEISKTEVHPLEALFKRPTSKDKDKAIPPPINTAFSFFGDGANAADDEDDNEESRAPVAGTALLNPPMTPYTKRDRADRVIRSAAPTPDTAAIGKRFSQMPWSNSDEDSDSNEGQSAPQARADPGHASPSEQIVAAVAAAADAMTVNTDADEDVNAPEEKQQSEFEKHFWANRGDYNRAWKQRKREAKKEKRQLENKRSGFGKAK